MFFDDGNQLKNFGMQLQNMGTQIQNYGLQIQNMMQNIGNHMQNLGIEITNIGIQIFNMGMKISNQNQNINNMIGQNQFMGIQMFNMLNSNNNDWMMNFCGNNINNKEKKINFTFKTIKGERYVLSCNENITIEELFKLYAKKANLNYDLIKKQKIFFIFNAQKLSINDQRQIKEVFIWPVNTIMVEEF